MNSSERLRSADLLSARFDSWGIERVAVDLDSTLIDTTKMFKEAMIEASGHLLNGSTKETVITPVQIKEQIMDPVIMELRREFGIWPSIMEITVMITARNMQISSGHPSIILALERVKDIYRKDVPKVFDGAEQLLSALSSTGRRVYIMTHADPKWTRHKLDMTGLSGRCDDVVCFSIDAPKAVQWETQFVKIGIEPQKWLVIGDNREADIVPPVSLGALGVLVNRYSGLYNVEKQTTDLEWQQAVNSGRVTIVKKVKDVVGALADW